MYSKIILIKFELYKKTSRCSQILASMFYIDSKPEDKIEICQREGNQAKKPTEVRTAHPSKQQMQLFVVFGMTGLDFVTKKTCGFKNLLFTSILSKRCLFIYNSFPSVILQNKVFEYIKISYFNIRQVSEYNISFQYDVNM